MSLEQVLNVTPGSKVKELAFGYIDFMLRPAIQKQLAEAVWYSPANRKVKLADKYDQALLTTPEKVATLIQPDWKWYNEHKDDIDARVTKILKG
jgi:putative spermidine/putrescine transport system substrate-binding protein